MTTSDKPQSTLGDLLNPVDRIANWLNPASGLMRLQQRYAFASLQARAHDASAPSRLRKHITDRQGPNAIAQEGALAIRVQARHAVRNHDIARGIVRTIVNNVVGPNGIGIEPTPRRPDGTIHKEFAAELAKMRDKWARRPEVQRRFHYAKCQRMQAWAWVRDGEHFTQHCIGYIPGLQHSTPVPYSIELIDCDFVPLDYNDASKNIVQGALRNAWGEIKQWMVYRNHPNELNNIQLASWADLKPVDAARITQLASLDHTGQIRGISEFASILTRLLDIKDYEESERIAAKVAASMTAYIKRQAPEGYNPEQAVNKENGQPIGRDLRMSPGLIIDDLLIGEEIGLIDSNRPNPNLITFRQGQLRAAAAGIGASYSSISKNYDGTFSAQRQELVEQWVTYAVMTDEFVGMSVQPTWENLVSASLLSGHLRLPSDVVPDTADDALYTAQAMPWIDPLKEATAWVMLARAGFASEIEVLRKRGVNPQQFLEQVRSWRKETGDAGLVFTSNAANEVTTEPPSNGANGQGDGADGKPAATAAE